VAWQWLPFARVILLTAIQALDPERKEAARMDGAGPFSMFFFIIIPPPGAGHQRGGDDRDPVPAGGVRGDLRHHRGRPGTCLHQSRLLIYRYALLEYDVGAASAGGVLAIVLANVVAAFLVRAIAKNIEA